MADTSSHPSLPMLAIDSEMPSLFPGSSLIQTGLLFPILYPRTSWFHFVVCGMASVYCGFMCLKRSPGGRMRPCHKNTDHEYTQSEMGIHFHLASEFR